MTNPSALQESQLAVLSGNTVDAELSGLTGRYNEALRRNVEEEVQRGLSSANPFAEHAWDNAERSRSLVGKGALFAFCFELSNMSVAVVAMMTDEQTGKAIHGSSIQVGLTGGLAGNGCPTEPFTGEDLSYAITRLSLQRQENLVYGASGSPFLPGY